MASLACFTLLPFAIACQILGTFEKFPESLSARSAHFAAARGALGVLTRWACATQPGLPPLRAQFRSGVPTDWSFVLVLGLGEFLGVSLRVFYQ